MGRKFAKVFDLDDSSQVLITSEYDAEEDKYVVKCTISEEGAMLSVNYGYEKEEDRDLMFDKIDQDAAAKVYEGILSFIKGDE